ncbi:putative head-related protein [Erwinia phage Snitter]|nr:putative head-related protein [Erwinia phage Snitter]
MDYNEIRAMASEGISFFAEGEQSTYQVIISGGGVAIDPATGSEIDTPAVMGEVFGVIRDIQMRYVDGESILATDKRGIFQAGGVDIKKGMVIIVDGQHLRVVNDRKIKPGETVVAYRPILRQVAIPNG